MNSRIILLGLAVVAFSSCSTAYRTGQTPDDVYFSPARESAAYVQADNSNDDRRYRPDDQYRNNDYYVSPDDRWLRMRVRNRYRWSAFDDYAYNDWRFNTWNSGFYYSYSPFNTYSPFNNYWSNYYSWNSFYNPYCNNIIIVNPKINPVLYNRVRNFNLNSYSNNVYNNSNALPSRGQLNMRNPTYNNSNYQNSNRRVFSNSSFNNGNTRSGRDSYYSPSSADRPARVYQPSSSSSSSSGSRSGGGSAGGSGGSSGGGSGSRPSRGN